MVAHGSLAFQRVSSRVASPPFCAQVSTQPGQALCWAPRRFSVGLSCLGDLWVFLPQSGFKSLVGAHILNRFPS